MKTDPAFSIAIVAVSPGAADALRLIRELNDEMAALYPGSPIDAVDISEFESAGGYFVVAQDRDHAVGCGGFRRINDRFVEMKRLFVQPSARRRGIGRQILRHLEAEIRRRGYCNTVLETGCDNAAAIALYESEGYQPIRPFRGTGTATSRCYAKQD